MRRAGPGLLAIAAGLALAASPASADSFTPVTMALKLAPVARRNVSLPIAVTVRADPSVLDTATTPLRAEVKLAAECGGSFETTTGTVILNKALPQPALGKAYVATVHGSGRPRAFGTLTVCAFLEEQGNGHREYANDESRLVTVSPACTSAGARFDRDARALARARRALRHTSRGSAARRRDARTVAIRAKRLRADGRSGRKACGPGVKL